MSNTLSIDFLKRLLMANQLGIRLERMDGHRRLLYSVTDYPGPCDEVSFDEMYLLKSGRHAPMKEYGSPSDALDKIDACLKDLSMPPLLEQFHDTWAGDWALAWGIADE
jgi:hypothetical protein